MDLRRLLSRTVFLASLLATTGCGLLLDCTPTEIAAEPRPFLCQAEIFRNAGTEFTEQWQGWVFAADETVGDAACRLKLEEYVTRPYSGPTSGSSTTVRRPSSSSSAVRGSVVTQR